MTYSKYIYTILLFILPLVLWGQRTKELRKVTERIIAYDTNIKQDRIPGYICGMIDKDSTYIIDFGSASKTEKIPLDEHTIFEIGSLTKVFTMSLLAVLVDEGLFNYDDKINDLLPQDVRNKKSDSLTLRDLVMHTSSMPRTPTDFGLKEKNPKDPYAYYTKDDLLSFYGSFPFDNIADKKYLYSHVNYALIEIIMENVSGISYERLLQAKILNPLGLEETYLGVSERLLKYASKGYSVSGQETGFRTFQSFEGSLGLKSSLYDLMIFIKAYMDLADTPLSRIFSTCFNERISTGMADDLYIAYAWHMVDHKKYYDVVVHPGRGNGYQVTIHFIPETQTGVIILANSNESLDNLGYMMLALVNNHWRLKKKDKKKFKEIEKEKRDNL
jgi:D-alanyl-D-alanine-carboxypeptidase/D-alanyl-D-alanine-endopeptidase